MLEIHNAIAAAWMRGSEADPSRRTNQRSSPAQSEIQMLILTRGQGETIRIGEDIAVTVIGVQGKQVRIGIAAPKTVVVNREEVHARTAQARSRLHPG